MGGGGHTQASCLNFCDADNRCFYATYFADTGYCHIAVTCSHTAQTSDHPITYHKSSAEVSATALASPAPEQNPVNDSAPVDASLQGFDYGASNIVCAEWYGAMG